MKAKIVKVKQDKGFPGRFNWQCPKRKEWMRHFERTCESCGKVTILFPGEQ